jgi:hypothetical protein
VKISGVKLYEAHPAEVEQNHTYQHKYRIIISVQKNLQKLAEYQVHSSIGFTYLSYGPCVDHNLLGGWWAIHVPCTGSESEQQISPIFPNRRTETKVSRILQRRQKFGNSQRS